MRKLFAPLAIALSSSLMAGVAVATTTAPATQAALTAQINAAVTTGKSPVDLGPAVATENNSEYSDATCLQKTTASATIGNCVFGDTKATTTVVLYGDSNAAMWQPAFDAIGRSRHFRVILMARLGCTVTDIVQGLAWLGFTADPGCATFRTNAFKYISTLNKPRVFIAQLHRYPRAPGNVVISAATWNAATVRSLNKLRTVSSSLTWLIGVPSPPTTGSAGTPGMPSTCLAAHLTDTRPCNFTTAAGIMVANQNDDLKSATATGTKTVVVTGLFCQSTTIGSRSLCPLQVNGVLPYADSWHIGATYAAYVSKPLAQLLGTQLP